MADTSTRQHRQGRLLDTRSQTLVMCCGQNNQSLGSLQLPGSKSSAHDDLPGTGGIHGHLSSPKSPINCSFIKYDLDLRPFTPSFGSKPGPAMANIDRYHQYCLLQPERDIYSRFSGPRSSYCSLRSPHLIADLKGSASTCEQCYFLEPDGGI